MAELVLVVVTYVFFSPADHCTPTLIVAVKKRNILPILINTDILKDPHRTRPEKILQGFAT